MFEDTEDNKRTCFAWIDDNNCGALEEKNCKGCSFYRYIITENDPDTRKLIRETTEKIRSKENENK